MTKMSCGIFKMTKSSMKSPVIYDKKDVNFIDKITKFKGFLTLKEYVFRYRLFNGEMSEEIHRQIIERRNAVILLAYDPKRDDVVLIEQIRIAAIDNADSPWLIEVVAGLIDDHEEPEMCARRECKEEAGITVKRCKQVMSYLSSPGGNTERLTVFVGEVDAAKASGTHGLAEEGEDIRVHVVSRKQAYRWVEEGVIDNAGAIIALQWLQLHFSVLQDEWQ